MYLGRLFSYDLDSIWLTTAQRSALNEFEAYSADDYCRRLAIESSAYKMALFSDSLSPFIRAIKTTAFTK